MAMLLVHAADLHLGKTLHEREFIEEQEEMLGALVDLLASRRPAALLLAGDIYDRAIPSPAAMGLLDRFLSRAVEAAPGTAIVIIPGNHDSASRLAFGSGLFRKAGVHLRSLTSESLVPLFIESRRPEGKAERCAIWALPYLGGAADLGQGSLGGEAGEGTSADAEGATDAAPAGSGLFARAIGRILRAGGLPVGPDSEPETDSYNVLLAHCFARGGLPSESERVFVGAAEEVDAALFDGFDYAALGHLHRAQAAGKKGWYSGSPLAYSFGEAIRVGPGGIVETEAAARGFLLVELQRGGCRVELLPHRPGRRLVRIEASFAELLSPGAFSEYRGDYVELCLSDELPVLDPSERLRSVFPKLLSIRQWAFELRLSGSAALSGETGAPATEGEAAGLSGDDRDPEDPGRLVEEFAAFHAEMRGSGPDEATALLFSSLVEEAAHEAD